MQTQNQTWRSPEEIIEIGFQRSRVVMMNEAHSGLQRCIRTRQIGQRILPTAHRAHVRHLAMEALEPISTETYNRLRRIPNKDKSSYLSQTEMQSFIQAALDLDWTLIGYEADSLQWLSARYAVDLSTLNDEESSHLFEQNQTDVSTMEFINWREEQQARNIIAALQLMAVDAPLLVWCGNSHHIKTLLQDWIPMGYQFQRLSGIEPFAIDQIETVRFNSEEHPSRATSLIEMFSDALVSCGGTAGFLREEAPSVLQDALGVDAFLLSIDNQME